MKKLLNKVSVTQMKIALAILFLITIFSGTVGSAIEKPEPCQLKSKTHHCWEPVK